MHIYIWLAALDEQAIYTSRRGVMKKKGMCTAEDDQMNKDATVKSVIAIIVP